jgi:hypothetical protein
MGFIAGVIALEDFVIGIDTTLFPFTGDLLRKQSNEIFKLPMKMVFF